MNPNQEKLNFLCDFDENNANPVELERFKNYVNSS